MRSPTPLLLASTVALLAGCAGSVPTALPTVEYLCSDRSALRVTFVDEAAVVLLPTGYAVELPQQPTSEGFRYADERHELRGKVDELSFTLAGAQPLHCSRSES